MLDDKTEVVDTRVASGAEMTGLMNLGVAKALGEHKKAGNSVVVWDRQLDKVLHVPAHEIEIPHDAEVEAPAS